MDVEDYRIKYLKYKQKYTNALQNMQGGADIATALKTQPKAVYIVDAQSNTNLKTLLGGAEKKITKYSDCVDMLVGISNKKVIRIRPMTDLKYAKDGKVWVNNEEYTGLKKVTGIFYKNGLEHVNKEMAPAKPDKIVFEGKKFGEDDSNRYSHVIALNQLLNENNYFINQCGITEPHIVVFGADNTLCLCGALAKPAVAART
jgi:hypothetical protein